MVQCINQLNLIILLMVTAIKGILHIHRAGSPQISRKKIQ